MFLPGTSELFTLRRYQEEIGKDYKRIVLFLCKKADIYLLEHIKQTNMEKSLEDYNYSPANLD